MSWWTGRKEVSLAEAAGGGGREGREENTGHLQGNCYYHQRVLISSWVVKCIHDDHLDILTMYCSQRNLVSSARHLPSTIPDASPIEGGDLALKTEPCTQQRKIIDQPTVDASWIIKTCQHAYSGGYIAYTLKLLVHN